MTSSVPLSPSKPEVLDAVQAALIEVAEHAFFVFVEPSTDAEYRAAVARTGDAWLRASVDYVGRSTGRVEIHLPEELGRWLVGSLLGLTNHASLIESQLRDGVGEFANMVCGAWLSRAHADQLFALAAPTVERTASRGSLVSAAGHERLVSINDLPVSIRVQ